MATDANILKLQDEETQDHLSHAVPILLGHFLHDIYTGMVAPLLPVLIEKLSLDLTAAGSLNAIMQFPGLLNPLIGFMADRGGLRYLLILAPAITATLVSLIGFASGYWTIAILLFAAGVSTALFHAPAPPIVARAAGKRVGLGMSLFMSGGELGYAIGPLLAVWAVSTWSLEGIWRLMFLGWAASLFLYFRIPKATTHVEKTGSLRAMFPAVWGVFIPIVLFNVFRNPLTEALSTYLPIYLNQHGASLWLAGSSLTLVELCGIPGALLIGPLSDRIGRRVTLIIATVLSATLMLVFRFSSGWILMLLLALLGFTAYSMLPVLMAIVQEQFPNNRSMANGLYMMTLFALRPLGTLTVGVLGDHFGLETAFLVSGLLAFLMLPAIWILPEKRKI